MATLLDQAISAANNYNVPPAVFTSVIGAESNWNPNAYNASSGASGLGQTLRSTANNPGYGIKPLVNPYDAVQSLDFSAQYLKKLYDRFGSWYSAVQHYSQSSTDIANGVVPYSGSPQQGNVLSAVSQADGSTGIGGTTGNSPTTAAGSGSGSGSGSTNDTVSLSAGTTAAIGTLVSNAGIVILAVVIVGIGIWMLTKR